MLNNVSSEVDVDLSNNDLWPNCPDCDASLNPRQKKRHDYIYGTTYFTYLKCVNDRCGAEYAFGITLHRVITNVKIECRIQV